MASSLRMSSSTGTSAATPTKSSSASATEAKTTPTAPRLRSRGIRDIAFVKETAAGELPFMLRVVAGRGLSVRPRTDANIAKKLDPRLGMKTIPDANFSFCK